MSEYGGKVHGSQRDRDPKTGLIDLLVYYKVPEVRGTKLRASLATIYIISLLYKDINFLLGLNIIYI